MKKMNDIYGELKIIFIHQTLFFPHVLLSPPHQICFCHGGLRWIEQVRGIWGRGRKKKNWREKEERVEIKKRREIIYVVTTLLVSFKPRGTLFGSI